MFKHIYAVIIVFLSASAFSPLPVKAEEWKSISSPDGCFDIQFSISKEGRPIYKVSLMNNPIIEPSGLGFIESNGGDWTIGFNKIGISTPSEINRTWKPLWGERSIIDDNYNTATVTFSRANGLQKLQVEVRAYSEGVAFRYLVGATANKKEILIKEERTEFSFTDEHDLWAVHSAQGKYSKVKIGQIKHSIERPCILETKAGHAIAIAEAALVDFARMRLRKSGKSSRTLISQLYGKISSSLPLKTPWRVVMAADDEGALLENNDLLLNLNEPNQIKDTDWIRPGKVIRDVTLSTKGGMACVDFCVKYNLQFIEFDAGWYGSEREMSSDARTVSRSNLDLPKVISYAKKNNVGVILYVNRRHLERDLDDLLPLYKEWGISGIKFGFVQHGDQKWTKWMHDAIIECSKYQIMVDVHDEYRMTGWQRTYPNFMTAEGIGGDETRPTNEQALANMFNRMLASPADHTFCYFAGHVKATTSHAAQLAKSVCFFSPWQFLFWYDQPATVQDEPELDFFRKLPTTWDDTKVIHGKIGTYAAIARRKSDEWFIGCVNAIEPRELEIPLKFLNPEKKYEIFTYFDDPGVNTRTKVGIKREIGNSKSVLTARMSKKGGTAFRIKPLK